MTINSNGLNKNEIYEAFLQALTDAGVGGGGGGGGGLNFPDTVVAGTVNYAIPTGFNAIVKATAYNGGQLSINGGIALSSGTDTWNNLTQGTGNLYSLPGQWSMSTRLGAYLRGGFIGPSNSTVRATSINNIESNNSLAYNSSGSNSANTTNTTNGTLNANPVFANSTANNGAAVTNTFNLRGGDLLTVSGNVAYLAELYII